MSSSRAMGHVLASLVLVLGACTLWRATAAAAVQQGLVTVRGAVSVTTKGGKVADRSSVVVWLKSVTTFGGGTAVATPTEQRFKVVQQRKRFDPHLLVVPVGSVVEFPNLDPFFHNVFSLFDGKRFDLGLYEAGTSRSVTFPRAGVCYVFCNIHPDMSAVIVAVDSSHHAVSSRSGEFSIPNVPPGRYQLSVWHERFTPAAPAEYPREVIISAESSSLDAVELVDAGQALTPHKNKFGHDYAPPGPTSPLYH
ncbi:MAG: hypothetical protein HOP16_07730 [Acidobacteria bacterium]|nr:hypothetical protein [Acidobacteriota bacterium]